MLKARILTALALGAGFLAALFLLPDLYWSLLTLTAIAIAFHEWGNMSAMPRFWQHTYTLLVILSGLTLIAAGYIGIPDLPAQVMFFGLFAAAVFWMLLAPVWLMFRFHLRNPILMAGIGLVVLFPTWLAMAGMRGISPWLLLMVMAAVWIADSAAYFAGKRFGRHKLAPQISPGKTWEGVFGAWLAVTLYGLILCHVLALSYWFIVGLFGITVLSIMGDLFESLIKRQAGVKDSGSLLPGHGGLLDRIDGLTSSLPMVMFFIYLPTYYQVLESLHVTT
ncbi:MAG TPA: phosphatidate cytidylyltransferase [Methylophilaceae bacterium]|jgi:phosphatidate cytidylyltransferase